MQPLRVVLPNPQTQAPKPITPRILLPARRRWFKLKCGLAIVEEKTAPLADETDVSELRKHLKAMFPCKLGGTDVDQLLVFRTETDFATESALFADDLLGSSGTSKRLQIFVCVPDAEPSSQISSHGSHMSLARAQNRRHHFVAYLNLLEPVLAAERLKIFLSYAWPKGGDLHVLQAFLVKIAGDLRAAGAFDVYLDIERMNGNTAEYMETSIRQSGVVIAVCTRQMKERGNDPKTNVALELRAATALAHEGRCRIIPLLFEGELSESVPLLLAPHIQGYVDFTNPMQYEANFVELLPVVFSHRAAAHPEAMKAALRNFESPEAVLDDFLARARSILIQNKHVSILAPPMFDAAVQVRDFLSSRLPSGIVTLGLPEAWAQEGPHTVVVLCTPLLKELAADAGTYEASMLREVSALAEAGRCCIVAVLVGEAALPLQLNPATTLKVLNCGV
eukprot:TRINITY_DN5373_c0_g2_i1.p1 TRINITY_DN5373_c0_g2~~TRINITY_DN5373_c0_g2_i1.p1  ORF type:complete len:527 (-),score=78.43 TRINITY_DN5373_c0_g2_i1:94-1443(-)